MKKSLSLIGFLASLVLVLLAGASCQNQANPADDLSDLVGRYSFSMDEQGGMRKFVADIVLLGADDKGNKTYGLLVGHAFVDQIPDWLNEGMQPVPISSKNGKLTFEAPLGNVLGNGAFTLERQGANLEGTVLAGGQSQNVSLMWNEAGAAAGVILDDGDQATAAAPGEASDPGYDGTVAAFRGASGLEGQVVLEFEDDKGVGRYYCADPADAWSQKFYVPGEGPVQQYLDQLFAVQYRQGPIIDERGEEVIVRIPVSIVEFQRDQFSYLGVDNAYNLYEFVDQLQAVVRANAAQDFAQAVSLPLQFSFDGATITLESPADVVTHWSKIMNPRVRQAVLDQTYESLFVNANGLMIGSGALWFNPAQGGEFTLYAANP